MAYKMRISDWSSDRCSSDLAISDCRNALRVDFGPLDERFQSPCPTRYESGPVLKQFSDSRHHIVVVGEQRAAAMKIAGKGVITLRRQLLRAPFRSDEHTSELQSLMRISYAVFCLKKKKQQRIN